MEIIVASNNKGKIDELNSLNNTISVVSYTKYHKQLSIDETGKSYQENALIKASEMSKIIQKPVLGDDGGLELAAFPDIMGVTTARYFKDFPDVRSINQEIVKLLEGSDNRTFTLYATLVYYRSSKNIVTISKSLRGQIAKHPLGEDGYGFDSILYIPEKKRTLAQLSPIERQLLSPRIQAFKELVGRLQDVS